MATLQYMREYRTYEQIAADFGIHESNLIRQSQWVEATLIQNGFTISKTHLSAEGYGDCGCNRGKNQSS